MMSYRQFSSQQFHHSAQQRSKKQLHRGFTLIEIIISLVVISLALGAVIATTGNSVKHGAHIKEKTIALWVAKNAIAEVSITKNWLATGITSSDTTMAGRQWFIKNDVIQTPDKNMRKMNVSIYTDKASQDKVVTLTAYIVKPQELNKNEDNL